MTQSKTLAELVQDLPAELYNNILDYTLAIDEDTTFAFTGAASITVTDPDAGADDVRLDLSVPSGVLDLASPAGLTFVGGTANHSAFIAVTAVLMANDAG